MVVLLRLLAKKWRFSRNTSRARFLATARFTIEKLAILQLRNEKMEPKTRGK
jgi:hypothetical protein